MRALTASSFVSRKERSRREDDLQRAPGAVSGEAFLEALERKDERGEWLELGKERDRLLDVVRRCRAGADDRELAPVDAVDVDRNRTWRGREDDDRAAGLDASERIVDAAGRREDGRVRLVVEITSAERARDGPAFLERVGDEDVVTAAAEDLDEEEADEPTADDENAAPRHALGGAKDARERLGEGRDRVVEPGGEAHRGAPHDALGESSGLDRRRSEIVARRLVSCRAAFTLAAREMMDEDDFPPVPVLGDDFVAEHGARRGGPELLDVAPAKAAGADAEKLAVSARLRNVPEPRPPLGVDDDSAHGRMVGG